jgi:hypothetical protein
MNACQTLEEEMGGAECRSRHGMSEEDVLSHTWSSALISVDLTASPVSVASKFNKLHYFNIELRVHLAICLSVNLH